MALSASLGMKRITSPVPAASPPNICVMSRASVTGLALRTGSIAVDMPRIQSTSNISMVWRRARIWVASPLRIRRLRARSARSTTSRGATDVRIACISTAETQRRGTATAPASAVGPRTARTAFGSVAAGAIWAMRPRRRSTSPRLASAASNICSSASRATAPPVWSVTVPVACGSRV